MQNQTVTIKEMMDCSNKLFEQNKDKWDKWMGKTPESNIYWISWLVGEIGEVIDLVKKKGTDKIMNDKEVRDEMIKEITDCYMYLADILNRYEFTPEEFTEAYRGKMQHNLGRDYLTDWANQ